MRVRCNVGPRERYVRLTMAAALGAAALSRRRGRLARILLGTGALAGAVTAWTRYCPINAALGIDNCRREAGRQFAAPRLLRIAPVEGISMRWEDHPRGGDVPVVMIHGIPTDPRLWRYVIPHIEGARCLAWEMVGYGGSIRAGLGRDISIAAQAEYLEAWLDHLGLEQAVFVGHDLGGGVVQRFAVAHPERVLGLVLTNCIAYDNWPVASVRAARWAARAGLLSHVPAAVVRLMLFGTLLYPQHDRSGRRWQSARLHVRLYTRELGPEGLANQVRHLRARDTLAAARDLPALGRRGIPALVVWGDRDPLGLASARRLARDLDAPLRRLRGARHFTPEDHPEELARAIRDVLRQVEQNLSLPAKGAAGTGV